MNDKKKGASTDEAFEGAAHPTPHRLGQGLLNLALVVLAQGYQRQCPLKVPSNAYTTIQLELTLLKITLSLGFVSNQSRKADDNAPGGAVSAMGFSHHTR